MFQIHVKHMKQSYALKPMYDMEGVVVVVQVDKSLDKKGIFRLWSECIKYFLLRFYSPYKL